MKLTIGNSAHLLNLPIAFIKPCTSSKVLCYLFHQVVTGEFSWVDALGTRHVTVYRADENGYHILQMRKELGFVNITPNNLQPKKKVAERENKVAIANSRGAKLLERNRSFQNQPNEVTFK